MTLGRLTNAGEKKGFALEAQVTRLRKAHKYALLTTTRSVHRDGAEGN